MSLMTDLLQDFRPRTVYLKCSVTLERLHLPSHWLYRPQKLTCPRCDNSVQESGWGSRESLASGSLGYRLEMEGVLVTRLARALRDRCDVSRITPSDLEAIQTQGGRVRSCNLSG